MVNELQAKVIQTQPRFTWAQHRDLHNIPALGWAEQLWTSNKCQEMCKNGTVPALSNAFPNQTSNLTDSSLQACYYADTNHTSACHFQAHGSAEWKERYYFLKPELLVFLNAWIERLKILKLYKWLSVQHGHEILQGTDVDHWNIGKLNRQTMSLFSGNEFWPQPP